MTDGRVMIGPPGEGPPGEGPPDLTRFRDVGWATGDGLTYEQVDPADVAAFMGTFAATRERVAVVLAEMAAHVNRQLAPLLELIRAEQRRQARAAVRMPRHRRAYRARRRRAYPRHGKR